MTAPAKQENKPEENKINGQENANNQPRVVTNPNDVASLVLMQIDAVNSKKDELTIAMKNLMDTSKQLVKAYGENSKTIIQLKQKLDEMEKS